MNLFSTLPIPDELQLKLSELVTAVTTNTYSYSGTYVPTLSAGDVAGIASLYTDPYGVSRVGNGAGVPSAGDTVVAYGALEFIDFASGERFDMSLPFEADAATPFAVMVSLENGHSVSCKATLGDLNTLWVFMDSAAAMTVAYITVTYRTANAVD